MLFFSLSKLNASYGSSFQRTVTGKVRRQRNLAAPLSLGNQTLNLRSSSPGHRAASGCSTYGINKYSIEPAVSRPSCTFQSRLMVASKSQSISGDVCVDSSVMGYGNVVEVAKLSTVFFGDRSVCSSRKANIRLRHQNVPGPFPCLASRDVPCRMWHSRPSVGQCYRDLRSSCSASYSGGAAADVPFNLSTRNQHLENTTDSHECKNVSQETLKLLSGSCYLPHPDKIQTGGEDAHFICEDEKVIGVADGVGGWADVGVDAGEYARQLMSNSVSAIQAEPKGIVDPTKVLEKAHASTKVNGSSTACIIALTDQGIHAINLGDSGFIVIRDGSTVFRSPAQQYGFNFPFQLASGSAGDQPSSGQVFTVPVSPGDVIVVGTDGLFDNLYDKEIVALVVQASRSGVRPPGAAQKIANLAQQRAQDAHRQTPFSSAAHDAGVRYFGGKLDDITVIVAYVTAQ